MEINNSWGVGVQGDHVVILMPPGTRMAPYKAKLLAAYLVSMAEIVEVTQEQSEVAVMSEPFQKILDRVRGS